MYDDDDGHGGRLTCLRRSGASSSTTTIRLATCENKRYLLHHQRLEYHLSSQYQQVSCQPVAPWIWERREHCPDNGQLRGTRRLLWSEVRHALNLRTYQCEKWLDVRHCCRSGVTVSGVSVDQCEHASIASKQACVTTTVLNNTILRKQLCGSKYVIRWSCLAPSFSSLSSTVRQKPSNCHERICRSCFGEQVVPERSFVHSI